MPFFIQKCLVEHAPECLTIIAVLASAGCYLPIFFNIGHYIPANLEYIADSEEIYYFNIISYAFCCPMLIETFLDFIFKALPSKMTVPRLGLLVGVAASTIISNSTSSSDRYVEYFLCSYYARQSIIICISLAYISNEYSKRGSVLVYYVASLLCMVMFLTRSFAFYSQASEVHYEIAVFITCFTMITMSLVATIYLLVIIWSYNNRKHLTANDIYVLVSAVFVLIANLSRLVTIGIENKPQLRNYGLSTWIVLIVIDLSTTVLLVMVPSRVAIYESEMLKVSYCYCSSYTFTYIYTCAYLY